MHTHTHRPPAPAVPPQAKIRRLEAAVVKLQADLKQLKQENRALKQKSFVLARKLSFRRCAETAVADLKEVRRRRRG